VDYHFRPRAEIERLVSTPGFVAGEVRGDFQGLDLATIDQALDAGHDAFFEGNPFIPEMLREAGVLDRYPTLTVFLSPLGRDEIIYLQDPARRVDLGSFVTDVMRRKLLRRTTRQKTHLSQLDLEDIERRATSAIAELRHAHKYDHVIANHDGEDSENWDAFYYPVGDAFATLASFAALLKDESPQRVEKWDAGLVS
jgi:guanylate kinase